MVLRVLLTGCECHLPGDHEDSRSNQEAKKVNNKSTLTGLREQSFSLGLPESLTNSLHLKPTAFKVTLG